MIKDIRLEKKFIYQKGDVAYKVFLINGMFRRTYPKRKINSIYFDCENLKNVWDNINGFGNRVKIRLRWYNDLQNKEVFLEEKKKINLMTVKNVKSIGVFKNIFELKNYIDEKLYKEEFFLKKKININEILTVSYDREYFQDCSKKLRVTIDKNIKILKDISSKSIEVEKDIIEIKYQPKYANFCKNFILKNNLNNRNQKFSKYVNSFIELNDSGIL